MSFIFALSAISFDDGHTFSVFFPRKENSDNKTLRSGSLSILSVKASSGATSKLIKKPSRIALKIVYLFLVKLLLLGRSY